MRTILLRAKLLLALLLAVVVLGCAGPSRFGNIEQILAMEVGRMTYEQALDRWGEPTSLDKGDRLFTALWERQRSGGLVTERVFLTFDNRNQVMRSYRYYSKPFE
ncbi:MAG: hypothetical protein HY910_07995 [Desulfarculus sp.]|nr:hypothetical protein [Desulfarculus sp.]